MQKERKYTAVGLYWETVYTTDTQGNSYQFSVVAITHTVPPSGVLHINFPVKEAFWGITIT